MGRLMEDFYKATSTPEQAAHDLVDFVCSMMRLAASEQTISPVNKSCETFATLIRTLSYVEGMSRYELITGASKIMRERLEKHNEDLWVDTAAKATMHYADLCSSSDGFSRARKSKSKTRMIESARYNANR